MACYKLLDSSNICGNVYYKQRFCLFEQTAIVALMSIEWKAGMKDIPTTPEKAGKIYSYGHSGCTQCGFASDL